MKRTIFLIVLAALIAVPMFAAPAPSKAVANQSLDSRAADLGIVRDFVANDQVAAALAERGFTQDQINQRVAQLSNQDLHQLAQNLNQMQAGGMTITNRQWMYILIGAVAILILAVTL